MVLSPINPQESQSDVFLNPNLLWTPNYSIITIHFRRIEDIAGWVGLDITWCGIMHRSLLSNAWASRFSPGNVPASNNINVVTAIARVNILNGYDNRFFMRSYYYLPHKQPIKCTRLYLN
jgi:hypothetical protein